MGEGNGQRCRGTLPRPFDIDRAIHELSNNIISDVWSETVDAETGAMNYDSDSSDAGDDNYAATGVLLGYADRETTDDGFSQLGGYPVGDPFRQSNVNG